MKLCESWYNSDVPMTLDVEKDENGYEYFRVWRSGNCFFSGSYHELEQFIDALQAFKVKADAFHLIKVPSL